jgi:hypothetical protein
MWFYCLYIISCRFLVFGVSMFRGISEILGLNVSPFKSPSDRHNCITFLAPLYSTMEHHRAQAGGIPTTT